MPQFDLIPLPSKFKRGDGTFILDGHCSIRNSGGAAATGICLYLQSELHQRCGISAEITDTGSTDRSCEIVLTINPGHSDSNSESYTLEITEQKIHLKASAPAGLFYAVQSFLQMLPHSEARRTSLAIPAIDIKDYPRYSWRGMHLDVARHFFPKEDIKKYLDLLALHKLNVFHWHLTDDQGWRIEIKKYPRLTEVGAWRTSEESQSYGGYYTQDDIREVVEYAQQRFITIVPEIDLPGHCLALLSAYPEYSCSGGPFKVESRWGIFDDVLCPGKKSTYPFLQDIFDEICDLFSVPYVHLGGDECPTVRWSECPHCQQKMSEEGLTGVNRLHGYFIRRMGAYLLSKGKRFIGWDEILDDDLPEEALVMSWRGAEPGIMAASAGHDVIMSPTSHCYFDYYQAEVDEPKAIGGFLPLEHVYEFDPTPEEVSAEVAAHIIGGQGNLWTEFMPTFQQVQYMALPRLCALAEKLWSGRRAADFNQFSLRLKTHLSKLDRLNYSYRNPFASP